MYTTYVSRSLMNFTLLAFLFVLSGCDSFESKIAGDWKLEDMKLSFSKGEIMMKEDTYTWTLFGEYEILDRSENVIRFVSILGDVDYVIEVDFLEESMDWYAILGDKRIRLWTFTRE